MAIIEISTDFDGNFHWKTDSLDGRQALWLMTDTIIDMYRYFFQDELRPIYKPQPSRVCIELVDDKLGIAFRPEEDLASAKALTAAGLVALSQRGTAEFIDPFEVMFGAITEDTQETLGGDRILDKLEENNG